MVGSKLVDGLDLWSDGCIQLASSLLQPHTRWSWFGTKLVWKFQLALVAALYTDSTKQTGHASTAFAKLVGLINIPKITEDAWGWADAYDQTKLAGYWYMALFQEPIYQEYSQNAPVQDIGYIIRQTINHCSELRLPALHLLEFSVKHLRAMPSSSSIFFTGDAGAGLYLSWTDADGPNLRSSFQTLNPWTLLHLDTLLSPSSLLHQRAFKQLEWDGTPEQVHIAVARLALYDSSQGEEHKEPEPDPHLLRLFLRSKDYAVCTGAFKCCLNLATISQLSSTGDIPSARMFIPETMGSHWVEHLIQVICSASEYGLAGSWEFLVEHLIPKWAGLSPSWCHDFALVFLFSTVHLPDMDELPARQLFAEALSNQAGERKMYQAFLSFLEDMLELTKSSLGRNQLTTLEMWLAQLPGPLEKEEWAMKLGNLLAAIKQHIVDETLGFFAELPMAHSEWMNDQ